MILRPPEDREGAVVETLLPGVSLDGAAVDRSGSHKYLLDDADPAAMTECVARVVRWMDSDGLG